MARTVSYDAAVIQLFAQRLYTKANTIIVVSTIVGGIVGAVIGGAVGVFSPRFIQIYAGMQRDPVEIIQLFALVAGVIGALSGYSRGREKSFRLKLEAQVALCQVQIEKNTSIQS